MHHTQAAPRSETIGSSRSLKDDSHSFVAASRPFNIEKNETNGEKGGKKKQGAGYKLPSIDSKRGDRWAFVVGEFVFSLHTAKHHNHAATIR